MIKSELKNRLLTSTVLLLVILLVLKSNFILLYSLIVFGVLSILEFFDLIKRIFKNSYSKIFFNTIFIIYISLFCIFFSYFSIFLQLKIFLFILLFGCIASDLGGYIFGKILKGPKLTKISPNKTISGSIGSFIFTFLLISGSMFFILKIINFEIVILSIMTSLACQLGDLFFSYLKRKAKVKDTGNFLPGHGGILDRLDGIYLGIPVGFITLIIINL